MYLSVQLGIASGKPPRQQPPQSAHGARFEVGSAEGVIGWLLGDSDAGG